MIIDHINWYYIKIIKFKFPSILRLYFFIAQLDAQSE